MNYIYLPLIDRVKSFESLFEDLGLPTVKHFDYFKNQYVYPELHHLYLKPAMFFEYQVTWANGDGLVQKGTVTIRWHLELENYAQSFDGAKNQDQALSIFVYHRLVRALLHGYGGSMFSPLYATDEEPDLNPTNSNVHVLSFRAQVTDDLAKQIADLGTAQVTGEDLNLFQRATQPTEENNFTL